MNHFHRSCLRNERVSRGKKMATIFHNCFQKCYLCSDCECQYNLKHQKKEKCLSRELETLTLTFTI